MLSLEEPKPRLIFLMSCVIHIIKKKIIFKIFSCPINYSLVSSHFNIVNIDHKEIICIRFLELN